MNKRKTPPTKVRKNERRQDLQIIRTRVSQNEMYIWAICLSSMFVVLTIFIFLGIFIK